MIEIKIIIKNPIVLEDYDDVDPELIVDDFINNTEGWLKMPETEITARHLTNHSNGRAGLCNCDCHKRRKLWELPLKMQEIKKKNTTR